MSDDVKLGDSRRWKGRPVVVLEIGSYSTKFRDMNGDEYLFGNDKVQNMPLISRNPYRKENHQEREG